MTLSSLFDVPHKSRTAFTLSSVNVAHIFWRMTKRGRGRPQVPDRDYRGEYLTVRLRPAEKRAILATARKAGARHTDWARSVLLKAAGLHYAGK